MTEKLYTQAQFQEITGLSRKSQWELRRDGKLGFYLTNKRSLRYGERHLQESLASRERPAQVEKEAA